MNSGTLRLGMMQFVSTSFDVSSLIARFHRERPLVELSEFLLHKVDVGARDSTSRQRIPCERKNGPLGILTGKSDWA
jgi:hypothetical protein